MPWRHPIIIIEGVRTPVTKANRGKLKDFRADQLLSVVLKVIPSTYLELNIADLFMHGPLVLFNECSLLLSVTWEGRLDSFAPEKTNSEFIYSARKSQITCKDQQPLLTVTF